MRTFELFVETLQKVEVQAETIEQAEQVVKQQLESNPRNLPGIWKIIKPQEVNL